jgi:two-component system, OmpR family, response regulator MtrA
MRKKRILIVDDDPGILTMLKLMLRLEGYDPSICSDPTEVVQRMTRESFDLVLLDAMMPHLDGLEVIKLIRSLKLPSQPPIILLTGNVDEGYTQSAIQIGASSILIKPFVKEDLLQKLETLLVGHP